MTRAGDGHDNMAIITRSCSARIRRGRALRCRGTAAHALGAAAGGASLRADGREHGDGGEEETRDAGAADEAGAKTPDCVTRLGPTRSSRSAPRSKSHASFTRFVPIWIRRHARGGARRAPSSRRRPRRRRRARSRRGTRDRGGERSRRVAESQASAGCAPRPCASPGVRRRRARRRGGAGSSRRAGRASARESRTREEARSTRAGATGVGGAATRNFGLRRSAGPTSIFRASGSSKGTRLSHQIPRAATMPRAPPLASRRARGSPGVRAVGARRPAPAPRSALPPASQGVWASLPPPSRSASSVAARPPDSLRVRASDDGRAATFSQRYFLCDRHASATDPSSSSTRATRRTSSCT